MKISPAPIGARNSATVMAGAEMIRLLKNPEIVVKYVRGGIYVYESRKDAAGKSE